MNGYSNKYNIPKVELWRDQIWSTLMQVDIRLTPLQIRAAKYRVLTFDMICLQKVKCLQIFRPSFQPSIGYFCYPKKLRPRCNRILAYTRGLLIFVKMLCTSIHKIIRWPISHLRSPACWCENGLFIV